MWVCLPWPDGKKHCFWIPIYYQIPVFPKHPDPGPYAGLIFDATILATVNEASKHITDEGVRRSLHDGVTAALKGMQAKAGHGVSINLEAPAKG